MRDGALGVLRIAYRVSLAVIAAIFLILSFPNFNIWILAWFGVLPLLISIEKCNLVKAFLYSYLTGFLFFLGTIYWLAHVTLPGMIIVVAYLAVYFGIFGLLTSVALRFTFSPISKVSTEGKSDAFLGLMKSPSHFLKGHAAFGKCLLLLFIPSAWVTAEWLRSNLLTGFPWALLAHSQAFGNLPVVQIADISGAYGVSFIILFINTAIYVVARDIKYARKAHNACIIIAFLAMVLVLRYGYIRLNNIFTGESLKVCVVQGNIPQNRKWDENFREEILGQYERLTKLAAYDRPDLIIWPETAVPGFMESETDLFAKVRSVVLSAGKPLLVGTPREEVGEETGYYNSAELFSEDGNIAGVYDKMHLVPFGEYVPFRDKLSFVEKFAHNPIGDFTAGRAHTVFKFFVNRGAKSEDVSWNILKKVNFSCLVCFEDIFPELSRQFVKNGASFLVNITNDAWFMKSAAPYQHAQCSVFRAVENRTSVIRAANTGLSCFIDQKGRVTDKVRAGGKDIFIEGYRSHDIILNHAATFYNRYGDLFAYACIAFVLGYIAFSRMILVWMRRR